MKRPNWTRGHAVELRTWAIVGNNPYSPPESRISCLTGRAYGHPKFEDGSTVTTSRLVSTWRRLVLTSGGTVYRLGRVQRAYWLWMRDKGIAYDSRRPVRKATYPDCGS